MLYRKMETTGDNLSILGFGCMRLPEKMGKIDEKKALEQLYYAIDNGVNYVDTALPYHFGASESFVGKALQNGYRDKVKLATKLPPWVIRKREDMDTILNSQLEKLKTDRIDYYLIHSLKDGMWDYMLSLGITDFIEKAKKDGRIKNIGFSFHGTKELFPKIVDSYDWQFTQIQYNYLDEQFQAGTAGLDYAAKKGLGIIIMEPLRGGSLAKNVPQIDKIWNEAETKRTPAEWALRWIWNRPEVTLLLSGMNEMSQIEENIKIASEAKPNLLTDKELNLVTRAEQTYRKIMKAGCTGCGYCMPCPAGVKIPDCLNFYNQKNVFNEKIKARVMYALTLQGYGGRKPAYASSCIQCGKCEKECPQNLQIMELLKDVKKQFEGFSMKIYKLIGKKYMNGAGKKALKKKKQKK